MEGARLLSSEGDPTEEEKDKARSEAAKEGWRLKGFDEDGKVTVKVEPENRPEVRKRSKDQNKNPTTICNEVLNEALAKGVLTDLQKQEASDKHAQADANIDTAVERKGLLKIRRARNYLGFQKDLANTDWNKMDEGLAKAYARNPDEFERQFSPSLTRKMGRLEDKRSEIETKTNQDAQILEATKEERRKIVLATKGVTDENEKLKDQAVKLKRFIRDARSGAPNYFTAYRVKLLLDEAGLSETDLI
jgi:hypothetical protein